MLQQGERLAGRYTITGLIGSGAFADVYTALDANRDNATVAVKVLRPQVDRTENQLFLELFARERHLMTTVLQHPHIVTVIDTGTARVFGTPTPYQVMLYYGGGTLEDLMKNRRLDFSTVSRYLTQMSEGLDHAHTRGVVHRDLKPANILLDNERAYARIADFGIARLRQSLVRQQQPYAAWLTAASRGTPAYAAPEQWESIGGEITPASDVYALGVIAYEMLAGYVPFNSAKERPPLVPPLPPSLNLPPPARAALDQAFQGALEPNPNWRWQKASAFAAAVQSALSTAHNTGFQVMPTPPGQMQPTGTWNVPPQRFMQQPQMQQSQWSTGTQPPPRYGTQPYVPQIQQRYPTQPTIYSSGAQPPVPPSQGGPQLPVVRSGESFGSVLAWLMQIIMYMMRDANRPPQPPQNTQPPPPNPVQHSHPRNRHRP